MILNFKNKSNKYKNRDESSTDDSVKLFRLLIDQSNDAIEVIDPKNGKFLDVNQKGCSVLGYTREEFLSLSIFDIDPIADFVSFRNNIDKLKVNESLTWEGIHKRKDGSTFPVEILLKLVNAGKDYLVSVARDITFKKQTEEKLLEYQNHLEELVKIRTKELEIKNNELERYNRLFEGRELRIKELRDKVKELEKQLGKNES